VIIYWIFTGRENLVGIFIAISLFTDWLDGIIARAFKIQTELGAKMDSWADLGTYICAFLAIYIFRWQEFKPNMFIGFLILVNASDRLLYHLVPCYWRNWNVNCKQKGSEESKATTMA